MAHRQNLVSLPEAAAILCFELGMTGPYSPRNLDIMADTLSQLCTLFLGSSADETIRTLRINELHGGRFVDGAKRMEFQDGRPTLEHFFVTRAALAAALAVIQRARTGGLS